MKKLLEKELDLMRPAIKSKISNTLENDFETSTGNTIDKVLGVHIVDMEVDTRYSNFRDQIVINDLKMKARVKVNKKPKKESTIKLKLNNEIHLLYHKNSNEYKVINSEKIHIVDLVSK